MDVPLIMRRKDQHLELCANGDVEFVETTTWLEDVRLVHHALPDVGLQDLDLSTTLGGKRLEFPLVLAAMTGGSPAGAELNRDLALLAEEFGIGLGLGSQRAALGHPEALSSFQVRDQAPTTLLIGNLGLQQVRDLADDRIVELLERLEQDMLAIHLNPAMELFQQEGDRDFRGGKETLTRLARLLGPRLMVKETGCGLCRAVGQILWEAGVRTVDVAGAGGTSWIRVECLRSADPDLAADAEARSPFEEWGIPTAASVAELVPFGFRLIASGGIRTGLDAARALALGADAVAFALPALRAHRQGGVPAVRRYIVRFIEELKTAMLLTGCRDLQALRQSRPVIVGRLREWIAARREAHHDE